MKIFILTFGCKVNQYESQMMLEKFIESGFCRADSEIAADVVIINSCTVTEQSDKKIKRTLQKIRKNNEKAVIVLAGCLPQAFPFEKYPIADIIIGNRNKSEVLKKVMDFLCSNERIVDVTPYEGNDIFDTGTINNFEGRTRAFIKIEDGCNRFCSYCIIPFARGRVRSKKIGDLTAEVQNLADAGYSEVVLVGINLSAYGQDIDSNLCEVVEAVCKIEGIKRVRLGSLEPDHMDEETIKILSTEPKFCPQFHISLQSGCNETLKNMNRHYLAEDYLQVVKNIKRYFENPSVTTDVMVGFPGETDENFKDSLDFVRKVAFSKIHVFPYSARKGTKAYDFKNHVSPQKKAERTHIMIDLAEKLRKDFLHNQVGKTQEVLFEQPLPNGFFEGYTKNYAPVKVKTHENLNSKIMSVKIKSVQGDYCVGVVQDS